MNVSARNGCVMKMKILIIVLVLLSCTFTCLVYGQENVCVELGGECVSIEKCDVLKQLIHKSSKYRDIVIKHICGFDGFVPRVCCPRRKPNQCLTLEGTWGSCVSIEMCSHLLERSNSNREDDIEYVQGSRCAGPVRNSVCCDFTLEVIPNPTLVLIKDKDPENMYNTNCLSANQTIGLISLDEASNNNTCCGIETSSRNKIIGGTETAIDKNPWLVMLEYERPYMCGGSLISSLYVLTAAHCLVGDGMKPRGVNAVRLGEYNTTNEGNDCVEVAGGGEDCTDGAITITINQIIVHPGYQSVQNIKNANDIGLLRLSKSAPYTEFIRPICLPSTDVTKVAISSDLTFHVAGWGAVSNRRRRSEVKLQIDLKVLEQKICEKLYSLKGKSLIWEKQFCAGGELNKDTCRGDSGGPLIYSDNDSKTHQIVGITSFGILKCGSQGRPSIYTKVIEYVPWILATTKIDS